MKERKRRKRADGDISAKYGNFRDIFLVKKFWGLREEKRKIKATICGIELTTFFCRPSHKRECINRILINDARRVYGFSEL